MKKEDIVQTCLVASSSETYLEIGVQRGLSISPIKAKRKWGVDPNILLASKSFYDCLTYGNFPLIMRIGFLMERIRFLQNRVTFFEMTSDHFFKTQSNLLAQYQIDVALIDGLHTYEQSMKDVVYCLKYLKEGGFIVMHDCNPNTFAMAYPANSMEEVANVKLPGWTEEWCGDVWKSIVHLRSQRNDLCVCVLDCDYGVGLIKKGKPETMLDLSHEYIRHMSYQDLASQREKLLNLKNPDFINDFIKR